MTSHGSLEAAVSLTFIQTGTYHNSRTLKKRLNVGFPLSQQYIAEKVACLPY